ncbi:MAG: hypothetical protein DRJ40_06705 [Thermoprotei archaeon]|nr:MAG: hypothetical protein DRJ40_06705 [Thermoprotei archaeon]
MWIQNESIGNKDLYMKCISIAGKELVIRACRDKVNNRYRPIFFVLFPLDLHEYRELRDVASIRDIDVDYVRDESGLGKAYFWIRSRDIYFDDLDSLEQFIRDLVIEGLKRCEEPKTLITYLRELLPGDWLILQRGNVIELRHTLVYRGKFCRVEVHVKEELSKYTYIVSLVALPLSVDESERITKKIEEEIPSAKIRFRYGVIEVEVDGEYRGGRKDFCTELTTLVSKLFSLALMG